MFSFFRRSKSQKSATANQTTKAADNNKETATSPSPSSLFKTKGTKQRSFKNDENRSACAAAATIACKSNSSVINPTNPIIIERSTASLSSSSSSSPPPPPLQQPPLKQSPQPPQLPISAPTPSISLTPLTSNATATTISSNSTAQLNVVRQRNEADLESVIQFHKNQKDVAVASGSSQRLLSENIQAGSSNHKHNESVLERISNSKSGLRLIEIMAKGRTRRATNNSDSLNTVKSSIPDATNNTCKLQSTMNPSTLSAIDSRTGYTVTLPVKAVTAQVHSTTAIENNNESMFIKCNANGYHNESNGGGGGVGDGDDVSLLNRHSNNSRSVVIGGGDSQFNDHVLNTFDVDKNVGLSNSDDVCKNDGSRCLITAATTSVQTTHQNSTDHDEHNEDNEDDRDNHESGNDEHNEHDKSDNEGNDDSKIKNLNGDDREKVAASAAADFVRQLVYERYANSKIRHSPSPSWLSSSSSPSSSSSTPVAARSCLNQFRCSASGAGSRTNTIMGQPGSKTSVNTKKEGTGDDSEMAPNSDGITVTVKPVKRVKHVRWGAVELVNISPAQTPEDDLSAASDVYYEAAAGHSDINNQQGNEFLSLVTNTNKNHVNDNDNDNDTFNNYIVTEFNSSDSDIDEVPSPSSPPLNIIVDMLAPINSNYPILLSSSETDTATESVENNSSNCYTVNGEKNAFKRSTSSESSGIFSSGNNEILNNLIEDQPHLIGTLDSSVDLNVDKDKSEMPCSSSLSSASSNGSDQAIENGTSDDETSMESDFETDDSLSDHGLVTITIEPKLLPDNNVIDDVTTINDDNADEDDNEQESGDDNDDDDDNESDEEEEVENDDDDDTEISDLVGTIVTTKNSNTYRAHCNKAFMEDTISLPDVVESTSGTTNGGATSAPTSASTINNSLDYSASVMDDKRIIMKDKRDLVNQESRLSVQLEQADKQQSARLAELQQKIDGLERELALKIWNVERLEAEINAAHREGECCRQKLTLQEGVMQKLRDRAAETEYELQQKYDELEQRHRETIERLTQYEALAKSLQLQLANAQSDAMELKHEKQKLICEWTAKEQQYQESIAIVTQNCKDVETKWHTDFEQLRTVNSDREEHLLEDCEWQIRTMQKTCKERIDKAEKERQSAVQRAEIVETEAQTQSDRMKHLEFVEAEVKQLRGLTTDQRQSIESMTGQLEAIKDDLEVANKRVTEEVENVRQIRRKTTIELCDKDRHALRKIEEETSRISMQWEEKLMDEMTRLKNEVESVQIDERRDAINKLNKTYAEEIAELTKRYKDTEAELKKEIAELKQALARRIRDLEEAQTKADNQLIQSRAFLERTERNHQFELDRETDDRENIMKLLREEFEDEKKEMEERFRERLQSVRDEFGKELTNTTQELASKYKRQLEDQMEQILADKEDAMQALESRHRSRIDEMELRIREMEITHKRSIDDICSTFDMEKSTLESRDVQNAQEIEQLHRKCRCLTKLFEEMRMRYERREPRPEDLREIADLKSRVEIQERDICKLTDRMRELMANNQNQSAVNRKTRANRKGNDNASVTKQRISPANINCDIIYEEDSEIGPNSRRGSQDNGQNV